MSRQASLPNYDIGQTYAWNYEHAPDPVELDVPQVAGEWKFCGLPVNSPLGVPAGPLLNGRWCIYYASLGFDVLTYKTVRSRERACYDLPNLQPVDCGPLRGTETDLPASPQMRGSWAVSFGMPSKSPDVWRSDVEKSRKQLPKGKLLSVSVVATVQEGWNIDDVADDYAQCAKWAVDSGADVIETNFSCPNVSTCDGQLFQNAVDARAVATRVRERIGDAPLIVKIGHVGNDADATALLDALGSSVNALAMTNSVATTVRDNQGKSLFGGQKRGICGDAIRVASLDQVRMFSRLIGQRNVSMHTIGVGGANCALHVREYLAAGAHAIHIATAAMVNPALAIAVRRDL